MARKHENFRWGGYKYAPESIGFSLNGKRLNLPEEVRSRIAYLAVCGKNKEVEDELKRFLRKEENKPCDLITFGFYAKDDRRNFYFTKQLRAYRTDLPEKLRIYKEWKHYIVDTCGGRLQPFVVTTGHITPYGSDKANEEDTSVEIDTNRMGVIIRFSDRLENRIFV